MSMDPDKDMLALPTEAKPRAVRLITPGDDESWYEAWKSAAGIPIRRIWLWGFRHASFRFWLSLSHHLRC
jgi:hypothetical protein